jgi:catechol 2,3-dioxygenase
MSGVDPGMSVGHVHLKVSDLDRSVEWYGRVLGLDLMARMGDQAAFMSAGGYHHHLGLNTWHSKGGDPPAPDATGLFHFALLYPTRAALGKAVHRVLESGVDLDGAADHGVSEAVYLHDPDSNGIELYRDRPREEWPTDADGALVIYTEPLDLGALLAEGRA